MIDMLARNYFRNAAVGMKSGFLEMPIKRIALAVVFSLLVHGLLLWQWPKFEPSGRIELPPLQAKLEALPKLAKKLLPHRPKTKPDTPPQVLAEPVASAIPILSDTAASTVATEPTIAESITPATPDENSSQPLLLPKHAQLTFSVQYGSGGFKVGEIKHVLKNSGERYTLHADTKTTGLASIFKNYYLKQTSTGLVTKFGLQPQHYQEDKVDDKGMQTSTARFDWDNNKIHFANGTTRPLLEQSQDILSLSYQLSQMPLSLENFPIAFSNGRSIKQYFIAVGEETVINTTMGELRTIPLRKIQSPNEDGLLIWLALEYRLLPVKIQYLDKSGEVTASMVITDIRVSDE